MFTTLKGSPEILVMDRTHSEHSVRYLGAWERGQGRPQSDKTPENAAFLSADRVSMSEEKTG